MKFTSIKQIPKEAIEMIDGVQWYVVSSSGSMFVLPERMDSEDIIRICNHTQKNGLIKVNGYNIFYIEPGELEDKTYGINLYKKIHGEGR